jgi:opacity protein-like surface antigen
MSTFAKAALAASTALLLLVPSAARAQDERLRVSFAPAVATFSEDAEVALGGTIGYRVSERLWFDGELTWIDAAAGGFRGRDFRFDPRTVNVIGLSDYLRRESVMFGRDGGTIRPILPILPGAIGRLRASTNGSTFIGTMGVRWELPVDTARFKPYVAGGLGLHHTGQRFTLSATPVTPAISVSTSFTGYAFSGGAGAGIRVAGRFWADLDVKYFRLSQDRDIMRLGGGLSVRF